MNTVKNVSLSMSELSKEDKKFRDDIDKIANGNLPAQSVKLTQNGGWSELNSLRYDVGYLTYIISVIGAIEIFRFVIDYVIPFVSSF